MSTIKADNIATLAGVSTSMANAVNGSAKAWVNFNGQGTVAIRQSYNVSSITDNGTGHYTINFTTAMPDVNYATTGSNNWDNGSVNLVFSVIGVNTSSVIVKTVYGQNNATYDPVGAFAAIFR